MTINRAGIMQSHIVDFEIILAMREQYIAAGQWQVIAEFVWIVDNRVCRKISRDGMWVIGFSRPSSR